MVEDWDQLPVMLTVKEAAELTRISTEKIYQMARTKDFPCVRFGRTVRIPRDLFRKWIEECNHMKFFKYS
jgi:excisionase family DNA binding protein